MFKTLFHYLETKSYCNRAYAKTNLENTSYIHDDMLGMFLGMFMGQFCANLLSPFKFSKTRSTPQTEYFLYNVGMLQR